LFPGWAKTCFEIPFNFIQSFKVFPIQAWEFSKFDLVFD
jgi:hypothetical protein